MVFDIFDEGEKVLENENQSGIGFDIFMRRGLKEGQY
jgi:hypothetical protein